MRLLWRAESLDITNTSLTGVGLVVFESLWNLDEFKVQTNNCGYHLKFPQLIPGII